MSRGTRATERNADALIAAANARLKTGTGPAPAAPAAPDLAPMQRVRQMATRVAASPINVLVLGECGVGKDVLANLIHQLSPRAAKPFVAFNCAAVSETVLESELFGHERGAFTGALATKMGLLESANGGTVFLDEIGDMPTSMQAKLLRAIENREVRPVGAVKSRTIDVRFISATNRDVNAAVVGGGFRRDLLDRLNTMTLTVPPLRERTDEIPALVTTFVTVASREMGRAEPLTVRSDVMAHLLRYRWPGNIRELKNVIERAVALCDGPEIALEHLPLEKIAPAMPHVELLNHTREMPAGSAGEPTQTLPTLTDPVQFAERAEDHRRARGLQRKPDARRRHDQDAAPRTFVSKLDYYGLPRPQKGWQLDSSKRVRLSVVALRSPSADVLSCASSGAIVLSMPLLSHRDEAAAGVARDDSSFRAAVAVLCLAVHLAALAHSGSTRFGAPFNAAPGAPPAFERAASDASPQRWNRLVVSRWDAGQYVELGLRGYKYCPKHEDGDPPVLRHAHLQPRLLSDVRQAGHYLSLLTHLPIDYARSSRSRCCRASSS